MNVIGIDIGTSFSSASIIEDGKPVAIKAANVNGYRGDKFSIPSSILVKSDGEILLGQEADKNRLKYIKGYREGFKRDIGKKIPYILNDKMFLPEDIYVEFFKLFKRIGEARVGQSFDKTIITCPASYSEFKKNIIINAAKKAGLTGVEVIPEPIAAAIYYSQRDNIKAKEKILVYDFGGGTFDLALIEKKEDGTFKTIGQPIGLENCGGMNFDLYIARDIDRKLDGKIRNIIKNSKDEIYSRQINSMILEKSIGIKHQLSVSQKAEETIEIQRFDNDEYNLTSEEFEEMIKGDIQDTISLIDKLIKSAEIKKEEINRVILVGGTTRIPYVRKYLEKYFEKAIFSDVDAELIVCYGAALYGRGSDRKSEAMQYVDMGKRESNIEKAEEYYKIALKIEPKLVEGYEGLLDIYITKNQDNHKARVILEKAIEEGVEDEDVYNALGSIVRTYNKEYELAKKYYLKGLEFNPNNKDILNNLSSLYFDIFQDYENARIYMEKVVEGDLASEERYVDLGVIYENLGNKEKAKSCYYKALQINPQSIAALDGLSNLHFNNFIDNMELNKDDAESSNIYNNMILQINEDNLNANLRTGILELNHKGNIKKAKEYIEKTLNIMPDNIEAIFYYAIILGEYSNDLKSGIERLKRALEIDNSFWAAHLRIAMYYASDTIKDYINAELHLFRAIEIEPTAVVIYDSFSDFYTFSMKDINKAVLYSNKAIELGTISSDVYFNLGYIYKTEYKSNEKAKDYFMKAMELNRKNDLAVNSLGLIYYEEKDYENASELFDYARRIKPSDNTYKENYEAAIKKSKGGLGMRVLTSVVSKLISSSIIE